MTENIQKVTEASEYITHLISMLSNNYDQLYSQNLDLTSLGQSIEALTYANTQLQAQKEILETRLAKLREKASS